MEVKYKDILNLALSGKQITSYKTNSRLLSKKFTTLNAEKFIIK